MSQTRQPVDACWWPTAPAQPDWPTLLALAARVGVRVFRIDGQGRAVVIQSPEDVSK
jgi:hypothetical protein